MSSNGPSTGKTTVDDESTLREMIHTHFDSLPPQQQAIANYLLDHAREVPFLSIPELAQRTGASEATVVRFSQRIGFEGFAELKMVLLELLRTEMRGSNRNETSALPTDDILASVSALEQTNLKRAVEAVDRREFRLAAALIFKADHVYTFGMGISAYLAELACYLLTQIGLRATPLSTRFSSPREQVVTLRPTDLVLAFSFPPYSRQTLALLEEATERGLPSIVVTDRYAAPATRVSRHSFIVPSHNMMFTNSVSSVVTLLNALVTEIAVRHQGEAVEALSRINRILAADDDLTYD